MYTLSMRPFCPNGTPNKCINFEQEAMAWKLSTFSKDSEPMNNLSVAGLAFYSPLESVDISIEQLAAMIAGLDQAYEDVCNALYADAPQDLSKTPWRNLATFMDCIPRGLYSTPPELPNSVCAQDARPVPFLYNKGLSLCLVWTGAMWGKVTPPEDVDTFDSAGTCFGWNVLYKEDSMSTDCVKSPRELADMLAMLLESLSCVNTDAKEYMCNIYSVQ